MLVLMKTRRLAKAVRIIKVKEKEIHKKTQRLRVSRSSNHTEATGKRCGITEETVMQGLPQVRVTKVCTILV